MTESTKKPGAIPYLGAGVESTQANANSVEAECMLLNYYMLVSHFYCAVKKQRV
jgi:hypothetical protein